MTNSTRPQVTIYTDGGAEPNPGPGGWGVVLLFTKADGTLHKEELRGGEAETTNNRMELTAAIEALRKLKNPCRVMLYTDSQYLQKGMTEWIFGWRKSNYKNGKIENSDLWRILDVEAARHQIEWEWVRGHANHEYNERADQLASMGRAEALGKTPVDPAAQIVHRIYVRATGGHAEAGWAALVETGGAQRVLRKDEPGMTVSRLYLLAVLAALESLPGEEAAHLFTDNDYLLKGIQGWRKNWKRNGWHTQNGAEVKHRDVWEKLDALADRHKLKLSSIEASDPHMTALREALDKDA